MTIKDLIARLKQMPQDVEVIESTMSTMENKYYLVFLINWMELQEKKLDE